MSIRKAIIPAAGLGTRMYTSTKSIPKEMLPLMNRPIIEHIVRDAVRSGIEEILVIISRGKESIIDHFSPIEHINKELKKKDKFNAIIEIEELNNLCKMEYVYQEELRGLGDAILLAKDFVKQEGFAVLLGDNIVESYGDETTLQSMMMVYERFSSSCIGTQRVPLDIVHRYGVMDGVEIEEGLYRTRGWVEKPSANNAPSDIVVAGQYIFTPSIFDVLEHTPVGKNGEIQITDAMDRLAKNEQVFAYKINGKRHDMGNLLSYIKSTVEFALKDDKLRDPLSSWIEATLSKDKYRRR